MYHSLCFRLDQWIRGRKKMLQSQITLVIVLFINFFNITILTIELLGVDSLVAPIILSLHLLIVMIALLALQEKKRMLLLPNVVVKLVISSISLFIALHFAESSKNYSNEFLIWILSVFVLSVWEMKCLVDVFLALGDEADACKPPPSYDEVADEEALPTYADAVSHLDVTQLIVHQV